MYKDEHRAQVGDDESNTEHEQELGVGSDKILNSPDEWLWGTGCETGGWHYRNYLSYMYDWFLNVWNIVCIFFL